MSRGFSQFVASGFALCLVLLCIVFALASVTLWPPSPLGADAPPDAYSAARARAELANLLGPGEPHPIGSVANNDVKARLLARLTELGLAPEVQDAIGCSTRWSGCGHVQNVVARIDGARKSAILLMAHYDSVSIAPGAGDDGAGVAALLEVARALRNFPPPVNSIMFAFTDGEEPGLFGAEAFFAQHAWARDVDVVINLEGSGSSGPVMLLRTGLDSGRVLDAFRSSARHAVASSFAEELFKVLPNDTDFSVAARADKPGIDFAFAGERNHYHTPLDTLANLSLATLQHHGDNVLPLVRALADADLSQRSPTYVYATLTQTIWFHYLPDTGLLLAIVAVIALGFATGRRWQGLGRFVGAVGVVVLTLAMIVAIEIVLLAPADALAGTRVAWPANPWPWRLIVYFVPIAVTALQRPLVRRVGFWNTLLAAWWVWALSALALAWFLPLASHVLLPCVVFATIVTVVLAFARVLDRPEIRCAAAVVIAVVAGFFLLPMAYMSEVTLGLVAAPAMFVPLALLAVTLLPLLDHGRVKWAFWIATAAVLVGIALAHWATLYSEQRPQHVNLSYVVDADAGRANYVAWSPNPLPPSVTAALASVTPLGMDATPMPAPLLRFLVFGRDDKPSTAPTTVQERAVSVFEASAVNAKTHAARLRPAVDVTAVGIFVPKSAGVAAIRIDGQPVGLEPFDEDYYLVEVAAPPSDGFRIEIDADAANIDAYVWDAVRGLPNEAESLSNARGNLAVPVHTGDRWLTFHKATF